MKSSFFKLLFLICGVFYLSGCAGGDSSVGSVNKDILNEEPVKKSVNTKNKSKSTAKNKFPEIENEGKDILVEGSFYKGLRFDLGEVHREPLPKAFSSHYGVKIGQFIYKKVMMEVGRGKTFDRYEDQVVFNSMCYRPFDFDGSKATNVVVFDGYKDAEVITRDIYFDKVSYNYGLNNENCLEVFKVDEPFNIKGVKRGMTKDAFIKILGEPTFTAKDYLGYSYNSYDEDALIEAVFDEKGLKFLSVYRRVDDE